MNKFIVTAAITGGIHTPTMSPYLPVTPDQIAEESRRACEAGAAVVHVHPRNPETGQPSADVDLFGEIISSIKNKCNVVVCTTTGGGLGQTTEQRVAVVKKYSPELASLNAGSMNFALFQVLEKGVMAKSNAEQVQKIVRIAKEHGLDPATPDEAREILGLKGLGEVKF